MIMDTILTAFSLVFEWGTLLAVVLASVFGLVVGAIPGLTATMAIALLVPITFFLGPFAAVGSMIACSAMAIFAGDIPGTLLRMPGTPASAAYTDEVYAMTRNGQARLALGANLVFSAAGGVFGTLALMLAAPALAEFATGFSSFEYFWMVMLGLTCATVVGGSDMTKGLISLLIGLGIATIGINNPAGALRFTFGSINLTGGVDFISAMIGLFAVSEILRYARSNHQKSMPKQQEFGHLFSNTWTLTRKYWPQQLRGNFVGVLVGALPGAGADIASWIAYAVSKKFSKTPEKFGTGHIEGVIESTSANNAALGGSWIPAMVFGIPGDTITAIVIGVLYMKGMDPGPSTFISHPEKIYAIFILFLFANLLMVPLGWIAIKMSYKVLSIPQATLMPLILLFCIVGAYATTNSVYGVLLMAIFGVLGYLMEARGFPVAPAILGLVLGPMLEESFVNSMISADGNLAGLVSRPVAGSLALLCAFVWISPLISKVVKNFRKPRLKSIGVPGV